MKRHLNRSVTLALLLLFSFSLLTLIIQCLHCQVQSAFYLWMAFLCISTWLTTCTKNGVWVGLPSSALLLFAASRYFSSNLSEQLHDVFDRLTGAYMEQIVFPGEAYPYLNAASDHSLLFLFLVFLLASYMGAAISSRSGRVGLALLGSVPFFVTCLAITVKPPVLSVFGMLLFWFLLAVGGSHYDEDSSSYLRVLGMLLPLSLLLSLLLVFIKPNEYSHEPQRPDIMQTLDSWLQNIDKWLNGLATGERLSDPDAIPSSTEIENEPIDEQAARAAMPWQDQRGCLDLTQAVDPSELQRSILQVRAPRSGSLYLRGVSYGDYIGTGWTQVEESALPSSLPYAALSVAQVVDDRQALTVRFLQDSAYRYLPYFCQMEDRFDSFVPAGMNSSYTADYYAFPNSFHSLRVPDWKTEEELNYRQYAHEVYTRLPAETYAALQTLCQENGLSSGMDNLISHVASFVQRSGTYDLETGAYPSDDYAVYFLTASHRGYCIHFATAAAVLYRCLGVPARIAEGFLVDAAGGKFTDVKGFQAHAWVEVYQDGVGWLPVEVTGQSGLDTDALGASETPPSPESLPEGSAPDPIPSEAPSSEAQSLPVGLLTQPAYGQNGGPMKRVIGTLLLIVLLVAALPLRRMLILSLRNRRFEQQDTRKAIIAMYQTAQSALPFGAILPGSLVQTAERAAFSQHVIRAEEVEACRDQLFVMLKSTYLKQNTWGKLRFKLLYALL